MNLLTPGLWPLVGLGLVPILIHLLMRRRYRHVTWAAMDFIMAALRRRRRRMQYRDMILMLLRALALSALGLAAARPSLLGHALRPFGGRADMVAAIVLDASLSMQHTTPSGSRFSTARKLAAEIVSGLPSGAAASLFLAGNVITDVVPEPSHDTAFLLEQIERCRPMDGGSSILKAIRRAWRVLESRETGEREIYVVTDMQSAAWPRPDSPGWATLSRQLARARPRPRLYLVNVDDGGRMNVALQEMRCADPLVTAGESIGISALVTCYGRPPDIPIGVECFARPKSRGPARRVGHVMIGKPESRNPVRFDFALDSGDYGIELRTAGDHIAGDNAARMCVPVRERLRVLIVDGSESMAASRFGGEASFLRAALLAHAADTDPLMAVRVSGQYAVADIDPGDYDAVALANVRELPVELGAALERFVRIDGGGLLVFAGERMDADIMEKRLGRNFLPARIGVAASEPGGKPFGISVEDLRHPIARFFDHPDHRHYLAAARFHRARRLVLPDSADVSSAGTAHEVVLRFDTGRPAMIAGRRGRGWVLVFAADAARHWTDLPLRPAYLMLMRRAVHYAAQYDVAATPKRVLDPIVLTVPSAPAGITATVTTPLGETLPALYETTDDAELCTLTFAETRWAGFYRANVGDNMSEARMFAVNPPAGESDLTAMTPADAEQRHPNLDCTWIGPADDLSRIVAASRTGIEVWPHLILLASLCLVTEQLLAARWAPRD